MEVNQKKNHNGLKIFAVILLFTGIAGIIYGLYMMQTPRMIFQESYRYATKGFKNLDLNQFQIGKDIKSNKISTTSNIKLEIDSSLGLGIKEFNLGLILQEDKANKTGSYTFTSNVDGTKLLDGNIYQKDSKLYLTIQNIMDKYYYMDQEFVSIFTQQEEYDFEILIDIVIDNLKTQIKDSDFVKESTTIIIDGKEEKATKLSLNVTNELVHKVTTSILMDIKFNDEALDLITKLSNMTKDEVIESLDEALKEEVENGDEVLLTYNIYYKMDGIKKLELVNSEGTITYTANNNKYEIVIDNNDENTIRFLMEKDENKTDFTLTTGSTTSFTGTLEKIDNGYQANIKVIEEEKELATLIIKVESKSKNESYIELAIEMEGQNYGTLSIDTKVEAIENVSTKDLTNAKKMDEMTEEEQNQMLINIMNHPVIGPILSSLSQPTTPDSELDYNYDYDYDYNYSYDYDYEF